MLSRPVLVGCLTRVGIKFLIEGRGKLHHSLPQSGLFKAIALSGI